MNILHSHNFSVISFNLFDFILVCSAFYSFDYFIARSTENHRYYPICEIILKLELFNRYLVAFLWE